MKDLSLHILDIAQNSITAGARHLDLTLTEEAGQIAFTVTDDGCGMSRALLEQVSDPFTTTRTTRKMGLGIPLLRMAAEQTGGSVEITSTEGAGTTLRAVFNAAHIDCSPCLSRARPCWRSSTPAQRTAAAFAWTPPSCGSSWGPRSPWHSRRWPSGFGIISGSRRPRCTPPSREPQAAIDRRRK